MAAPSAGTEAFGQITAEASTRGNIRSALTLLGTDGGLHAGT
jgi:hypothetical protein